MGKKILTIIIFSFILLVIANSGCIENTKANSTWGEKKISLNAIKISDNTTGNHSETNESTYYVYGYIDNNNFYEAFNPKITVTTFDSNGNIFAVNETPYIDPKNLPAKGSSIFYATFYDPDNQISNFSVEIVDAKAEYWS